MSSLLRNILLIGAGGKLGPSILSALSQEPSFSLTILSRASSTSTFPSHAKIQRISDSYPETELLEAFQGQDAIVSAIATTSADMQKKFIDVAIKAGVKRFVPSEFGGDVQNVKAMELLPQYFKGKKDTVEYLKGKEGEGLTWTAFVTGPFFDLVMKIGYLGIDVENQNAILYNDGAVPFSTTTLSAIGLAVKNTLLIPEKTANKYLYINSFTVSQAQLLSAFEKATGKKWEVTYADAEEDKKEGLEKIAKGDFSGAAHLIRYINLTEGYGGNYMQYKDGANELLSLPKESLNEMVAGIAKN
ncbi:isoflavone reductase family protein [Acephala macrosclerotiorum]|nr:isoflavone reductase family protein [Acephala macrosclerotiorum]